MSFNFIYMTSCDSNINEIISKFQNDYDDITLLRCVNVSNANVNWDCNDFIFELFIHYLNIQMV